MLSQIKNSAVTKLLWGLMGIYLLNLSVDATDPNPEHIAESISYNDQESIIEIVIEKILGYEDAINDYDDHDTEDHNYKPNFKIDLIAQHNAASDIKCFLPETTKQEFPIYNSFLTVGFQKLVTPPPQI